ncbi:hypothetical protein MHYP_G00190830 [Metynnis hypsauchen]
MMDLSAFQRFINEPAELRSPGDNSQNEQIQNTTEKNKDVPKKLQPPKPISRCITKSTLSKAAAPLYPKPESSLDIVIKGVALNKKDASTIIQPTPPAEPKPRKHMTQRRPDKNQDIISRPNADVLMKPQPPESISRWVKRKGSNDAVREELILMAVSEEQEGGREADSQQR